MRNDGILKVFFGACILFVLSICAYSEDFSRQKALLLSSSGYKDTGYLTHALPWIKEFVKQNKLEGKRIAFVPYAGVRKTYDEYESQVKTALKSVNVNIISIHKGDAKDEISKADAIFIGGGNTFELVYQMYDNDIMELIQKRVREGIPYIGWSAGSNVAGATMQTTNDMPIVEPKSFKTLNIFPYQINPHFISGKPVGHNGESREERLEEFLIINKDSTIYALPEGVALSINGEKVKVLGMDKKAPLLKMQYKKEIQKIDIDTEFKIN